MNEACCRNCKYRVDVEIWDYGLQKKGKEEWKFAVKGFGCTMFVQDEGDVIVLLGVDESKEMCEMYEGRSDDGEDRG